MKNRNPDEDKKQFVLIPLSSLSLNFSFIFLIDCVLNYAVVQNVIRELNYANKVTYIKYDLITKWSPQIENSYRVIRKQKLNSLFTLYLKYKIIAKLKNNFQNKHKKNDALIMVYHDLIYDIYNKKVLSERQFRILCAIYSVIGRGNPKPIYNNTIRLRSFGYMTELAYKEAESNTKQVRRFYSNKILSKEINCLRVGKFSRNFFHRFYDGRKYYYSRFRSREYLECFVTNIKLQHKLRRDEESLQYAKFSEKYNKLSKEKLNDNELNKYSDNIELQRRKSYQINNTNALERSKLLLKRAKDAYEKRQRLKNNFISIDT